MGRRFRGVGRKNDKSIEIDFMFQGERCREYIKAEPSAANLQLAAQFRQEIIAAIKAGTFEYWVTFPNSKRAEKYRPAPPLTIGKYLKDWLEDNRSSLKTSTYRGYSKIIHGHLVPEFGALRLDQISKKDIKKWMRQSKISYKTAANILSPLRTAMKEAVEDELIDFNPLADLVIRKPRTQPKVDKIDPFTPEEIDLILSAVEGQNQNLIQFLVWTGLRTSEICALNWDDIDLQRNKIRVNKALTQVASEPEAPKTRAGDRWIQLLAPAREALMQQKQFTYLKSEEIFQNPRTGKRWTGDQPIRRTMWTYALKKAGVRYRYPYQLRHTFATMMLNGGESIRWISEHLGHTTWTFTARTYTRFMPSNFIGAGDKAVAMFNRKTRQ